MRIDDVHVERVRGIPHGAKLVVDAPEGEVPIVWVEEDGMDSEAAACLASALMRSSPPLPQGHQGLLYVFPS